MDPAGWEKALLTLSKVPAEKLVPGHGDIGSKEGIADSLAYLHAVNQLARKFVDNAMRDDMMDAQIRRRKRGQEHPGDRRAHRQRQGRRPCLREKAPSSHADSAAK